MDFILALLLSLMGAIVAAAVGLVAGFFVFGFVFHLGDLGIALTEIGGAALGIVVLIFSFRKLWS
jgi:hypothetical protein